MQQIYQTCQVLWHGSWIISGIGLNKCDRLQEWLRGAWVIEREEYQLCCLWLRMKIDLFWCGCDISRSGFSAAENGLRQKETKNFCILFTILNWSEYNNCNLRSVLSKGWQMDWKEPWAWFLTISDSVHFQRALKKSVQTSYLSRKLLRTPFPRSSLPLSVPKEERKSRMCALQTENEALRVWRRRLWLDLAGIGSQEVTSYLTLVSWSNWDSWTPWFKSNVNFSL